MTIDVAAVEVDAVVAGEEVAEGLEGTEAEIDRKIVAADSVAAADATVVEMAAVAVAVVLEAEVAAAMTSAAISRTSNQAVTSVKSAGEISL